MFNFETGSLVFVPLNIGSQILSIQRIQIYWKSRSQIFLLNYETGRQFFGVSEHWEPDFKFSNDPNLLKIEEPDFFVKLWNWEPIFRLSELWEPDFKFSKDPDLLKIEEPDFRAKFWN